MTHSTISSTSTRTCRHCASPIRGRSDKQFCDQGCRTSYHNERNRLQSNHMRMINRVLGNNRRILLELSASGQSSIQHEDLVVRGYQLTYFTSLHDSADGRRHRYCYEVGLLDLDDGRYAIVYMGARAQGLCA